MVVPCAVLVNLALVNDNLLPEDEDLLHWQTEDGFLMRDNLVGRLFR